MRVAALALLLLAACATTPPVEPGRVDLGPGPWGVIVVSFDTSSLAPAEQWMGAGVAKLVSLGLVRHPGVVQIERERLRPLCDPDAWSETRVQDAARVVHADAALYGRIKRQDGALVLQPFLLDGRTGRTAALPAITVTEPEFLARVAPLAAVYARAIQPDLPEIVAARIDKAARPTISLPAFKLFTAGQSAFCRGDREEAVGLLARACEVDPNFVRAHYTLGTVHVSLGNRWKAAAQFRATVHLDWNDAEAHKALGDLFLQAPRSLVEQAIEAYSKAIEIRPYYADAHVGLGNARSAKGDTDGAVAAYQAALRFDPFNPVTHVKLGKILADRGLCAESEKEYRRARELDPRSPAGASPCAR